MLTSLAILHLIRLLRRGDGISALVASKGSSSVFIGRPSPRRGSCTNRRQSSPPSSIYGAPANSRLSSRPEVDNMTQGQPTILQTVARHCLSLQAVNPTLYRDLEPLGSVSSHAQGLRDDKEQPPCHPQDLVTRGRIERARRPRCPQQRVGRPRALHPPVVTSGHSTAQAIMYVPSLGSLDDDDGTKLVFVRVRVRVRRNVREQASSSEALHSGRFFSGGLANTPAPFFNTLTGCRSRQLRSAQTSSARRSCRAGTALGDLSSSDLFDSLGTICRRNDGGHAAFRRSAAMGGLCLRGWSVADLS